VRSVSIADAALAPATEAAITRAQKSCASVRPAANDSAGDTAPQAPAITAHIVHVVEVKPSRLQRHQAVLS